MAKEFSHAFYKSAQWKKVRKAYAESVNGLCERCGELGDEVHHKTALTPENINDPSIAYGWDNLELLCFSCHQKETWGRGDAIADGFCFDDSGDIAPILKEL